MARPKKNTEELKRNRLELRLSDEELETIDYVAKSLKLTRSAAILATMEYRADEIWKSEQNSVQ